SEDRSCYVYDIRQTAVVQKYRLCQPHTDTVTALAFHPWFPQLVTGTTNGGIHFWNASE
ncbi:WD repeat domain protein, partial [Planoprotostelium fungivorum]